MRCENWSGNLFPNSERYISIAKKHIKARKKTQKNCGKIEKMNKK
jgi:hypothetical protein